ncbi:hypothetical protein CEXT_331361 [Caerostris extrusa]|uniref:Uncharacterized protein n=1 Tax=Caerostris extrusa TaxID=172846 RepID=A0AAV4NQJ5_CAEEX|nr:hypothetical protein CEXT_331361 [Caerostris extrusa]
MIGFTYILMDQKMLDNVGVVVYSELFAFYASLGPFWSSFDGELEIIRVATKQIRVEQFSFFNQIPCPSHRCTQCRGTKKYLPRQNS